MKKYLLLAVSLILIFAACNKKPGTPTATRESMLRSGKWKITSGTLTVRLSNGGDTVLNYMNWIPACRQDDYLVLIPATTVRYSATAQSVTHQMPILFRFYGSFPTASTICLCIMGSTSFMAYQTLCLLSGSIHCNNLH